MPNNELTLASGRTIRLNSLRQWHVYSGLIEGLPTRERNAAVIQAELDRSGFRDCFELVTRWAAEPLDLLRELRRLKPTVVHFSGHGALRPAPPAITGPVRSGSAR